ncbi:hypothetical protein BCV70DRAFT_209227 [Testicularia cyperi]|uniref:Low temperature requirement A n=1 Tax=Testicularia cyperi TaxID=1882483 RepID=A0A317XXJ4_9BASI|nr:hypothetical protein BCV70DRAFT_209227 [Testicularia cyperi]
MSQDHRGSVASVGSQSHVLGEHRPHHLKYGNVNATGFYPDESDDEQEADKAQATSSPQAESNSYADLTATSFSAGSSSSADTKHRNRDAEARQYRRLERQDAHNRRLHQERRYLFRHPRALQYFRGNVLVRSEDERSSHRLELFFDLVFVGLIATLAEEAIHEHNADAVVRYILTYTAAWMIWNYMREIFNAFFVDDLPQRLLVLAVMTCLVVYGNNATAGEESWHESGARATAIGSYLIAGALVFSMMFFYSFFICQYRIQIRAQAFVWTLVLGLWIGSVFVSVHACIAMVSVALFLEYASWMFFYSPLFKRIAKLRYSSAVAIEHEIDRFNDFITLVHGEFLYSVISGQPAGHGLHSGVARVALTVVIAFVFHGLYCLGAGSKRATHPIRRSMSTAMAWFILHLPLAAALTLCGDSTAELVKEEHVAQGVRWMYAATYAISMVCTVLLVAIEQEHDIPGELYFAKWVRVGPRLIAALVVLLLPLADQHHINSTSLLGISAALGGAVWMWQELGALDGPNAPCANTDGATATVNINGYTLQLSRIWRGFPTLVEPGAWLLDNTHQRGTATTFVEDHITDPFANGGTAPTSVRGPSSRRD